MNSAASDIAEILQAASSIALVVETDLFVSRIPDGNEVADDCVAIIDNAGHDPLMAYRKGTSNYHYSSITVYCRSTDYDTAYNQAFSILEYLHANSGLVEGSTLYTLIKALGDPQLLYYDDNDRPIIIVNFEVQRRPN